MRPEQFVLQKIILRARERFEEHAENEHAAVNAVAPPSNLGARRVERHHDPHTEPEQAGDDYNLAKQKEAIQSFRPLRDHVYLTATVMRVRDGRAPSTRAKIVRLMRCRSCKSFAAEGKSHSHTIPRFAT